MNIQLVTKTRKTGDLVVPLFEKEEIPESARRQLSRKDRDFLRLYLKRDKVRGENVKSLLLPGNAKRILILGKGNKKNWNHRKPSSRLKLKKYTNKRSQHPQDPRNQIRFGLSVKNIFNIKKGS